MVNKIPRYGLLKKIKNNSKTKPNQTKPNQNQTKTKPKPNQTKTKLKKFKNYEIEHGLLCSVIVIFLVFIICKYY